MRCAMSKNLARRSLLSVVALVAGADGARAQSAHDIISGADRVRNPGEPFRTTTVLTEYIRGKAGDQTVLTVYSKEDKASGQFRNLVRYVQPPRDAGKMALLDGQNLWFYDPAAKSSVRISTQQRLVGQAAIGDVLTVNFAVDYTGTLLGDETISDAEHQTRNCWHLELRAATPTAVYSRAEYWVEHGSFWPIKAKFYSDSGRVLKVLYYRGFTQRLGAVRPSGAVIIDAVDFDVGDDGGVHQSDISGHSGLLVSTRLSAQTTSGMIRWTVVLLVGLLLAPAAWAADEDTDLNRIPTEAPPAAALTQSAATSKDVNYIGDALETSATRNGLAVPFPSPQPPSWEDWLFLDTRDEWTLGPEWRLNYSGRLNVRTSNSIPFPTHETVRNDLRELFVEWQPTETAWLELGRVNIRNGVALGFNPTDFLRPRTVIEPLTADPSVLREDRLGVLMLTGQWLWSSRSMTVAFAPKVTRPTPIIDIRTEQSFDPELGQTNTDDRVMIKVSLNLADTFNPELLYYHAGDRTQIGTNLTTPISRTTVAYLEWAGGVRSDLIADAFRFGGRPGRCPHQRWHCCQTTPMPAS